MASSKVNESIALSYDRRSSTFAYVKGGFQADINAILHPIHRGMLQLVDFEVLANLSGFAPHQTSKFGISQFLFLFETQDISDQIV